MLKYAKSRKNNNILTIPDHSYRIKYTIDVFFSLHEADTRGFNKLTQGTNSTKAKAL